jgi:hypothetical protein
LHVRFGQYGDVVRKFTVLFACVVLAASVGAVAGRTSSDSSAVTCGGEHRWDVKTLSDPDADQVRYDTPKRHTIRFLLNRDDPGVGKHTPRDPDGKHVELTVYHLVGVRLVEALMEKDADIHLVISSKYPDEHMIVEFPNVLCKGAKSSDHKDEMEQARSDFATLCGLEGWAKRTTPAARKSLSGTAALIGVGFFDLSHGGEQHGVAENNIELHPVLAFSAENCHVE